MPVRLKVMFKWNEKISSVGYYGYCQEISISDLVCGAKIDDCRFTANLWQFLRDRSFRCQYPVSVRKCRLR